MSHALNWSTVPPEPDESTARTRMNCGMPFASAWATSGVPSPLSPSVTSAVTFGLMPPRNVESTARRDSAGAVVEPGTLVMRVSMRVGMLVTTRFPHSVPTVPHAAVAAVVLSRASTWPVTVIGSDAV